MHSDFRLALSRVIASAVVVLSFIQARYWLGLNWPLLGLFGLVSVLCLNDGDLPVLGLRLSPIQGWLYWCRLAFWFGIVVGIAVLICTGIWLAFAWPLPIQRTQPTMSALIHMCIDAPLSEEIIFRALLTVAVLPTLGVRGTIVFGGVVFAALHVFHGNPGPDNQLAGFMLGWAFLKSRSILVPLAMHSAGNLIALGIQIIAWNYY
jgi:membrane protease YdiL (CAAX protease family)